MGRRPRFVGFSRLLASVAAATISLPVAAQTYTIQSITAPVFGTVAAGATTVTTFRNNGTVSTVSPGVGAYVTGSVTRGAVTIRCADGSGAARRCSNASNAARVTVLINGSPTGRAQDISSFTAVAGSGVTLTGSTTGSSLDFVMSGWTATNQDKTFNLNVDLPIVGDNTSTSTAATAGFRVRAALNPTVPSGGSTSTASATVRRATTVTKVYDIRFGRVIAPPPAAGGAAQTGTVTIDFTVLTPSTGSSTRTAGGAAPPGLLSSTVSGGLYTLLAQTGTTFSLTSPTSVTMNRVLGGGSINVTLTPSRASGSYTMVAAGIGLGYGAAMTINTNTLPGDYSGSFVIQISYN